eukprot:4276824-Lingulodinium_polyedra.AAC.1
MRNEPCGQLLGMGGRLRQNRSPHGWLMLAGSPHAVPPVVASCPLAVGDAVAVPNTDPSTVQPMPDLQ